MKNVKEYSFRCHSDMYGCLVPIEEQISIPFELKRVYYIYDVPGHMRRGFHSHRDLEQMLICVKGSVKILTETPYESEVTLLDSPKKGLYIGPMVWREMYDFSEDAVLLVLASEHYDVADYLRDRDVYNELAKNYFNGE